MAEERDERVRRIVKEVFVNGNLEAMDGIYDPGILRHRPPFPDVNGLQAYKESNRLILNAWSDIQITIEEILFTGDTSTFRYTMEMTHTGETPQLHIPPTGKRATQVGCVVAHWRGDKVIEEWLYTDYLGLLQQLGVIPVPSGAAK